ncbi:MAG TPA: extracellular solute-binding protein [Micropepsaceae bacterium]|nr:extracellular solute-binding protein [Micropepsaceae bacterium]
MKRPPWLAITLAVAIVLATGLFWLTRPAPSLTVVSWGDVYGRAQTLALFHPFADKSHVDVNIASYGGGLKEIATQVGSGKIDWDVVDLELEDAAAACRQGLLEPLAGMELPAGANGYAAQRDFVPGALGPCWVGSAVYSQVIAVDASRFGDNQPRRIEDFFDLQRFPGPRGLREGPKFNLELALLADGVQPWRVYSLLSTKEGVDRAFRKLDAIKSSIVWWRRTADPPSLLKQGKLAMTTALNARVFDLNAEPSIRTIWDGQLYQLDVFAIPKGDPKKELALNFIRFATAPAPLADEARYLPYGPARLSALTLVGSNPETRADMRPYLPTAPANFTRALEVDPDWWAQHGSALQARWKAWLSSN